MPGLQEEEIALSTAIMDGAGARILELINEGVDINSRGQDYAPAYPKVDHLLAHPFASGIWMHSNCFNLHACTPNKG